MPRPHPTEYPAFYHGYISLTSGDEVRSVVRESLPVLESFLSSIPDSKAEYAYAEGKWTVRQLLQHCIDTERIFAYRALCMARGEKQSLPGFDENAYAEQAPAANRSLQDLKEEWLALRRSHVYLFDSFSDLELSRSGISNGKPMTVNSIGFMLIGHPMHHINILRERYGL